MKCPKCRDESLASEQVREVEIDRCPKCRGIWFDDDELPRLAGLSRSELRQLQSAKVDTLRNQIRGRCPRDGEEMLRVISPDSGGVVIDHCVRCSGIWLDDGELAKLLNR